MFRLDLKYRMFAGTGCLTIITILAGCTSAPATHKAATTKTSSAPSNELPDLGKAMDKLQDSLEKPAEPFHISLKKSGTDGFVYQCEADVSSSGIVGQQTDMSPETRVGNDVFPASHRVRQLDGKPFGSPNWSYVRGGMVMTYLNGQIGDAQPGVKFASNDSIGGYDARRFDFDLTGVEADIKKAMVLGNAFGAARKTKDYNVKGSAWIAKEDGRLIKFSFENVYTFNDGNVQSTHFEGTVTKK